MQLISLGVHANTARAVCARVLYAPGPVTSQTAASCADPRHPLESRAQTGNGIPVEVEYQVPFRLPNSVRLEKTSGDVHSLQDEASFKLEVPPGMLSDYIQTVRALFEGLGQRRVHSDDAWKTAMTHEVPLMKMYILDSQGLPQMESRSTASAELHMRLLNDAATQLHAVSHPLAR